MAKKNPTPNDQRSTVKNPTSKQFPADRANTLQQRRSSGGTRKRK